MGSLRVRHDWVTSLSLFTLILWRRKWQPTPVFLPGESQGWGSLVGCCLWGRTRLKRLSSSSSPSIGTLASASDLPMNIQCWFPLGLTGLISLLSKELSRVFSSTTVWKHQSFGAQPFLWFSSHFCTWLLEKTIALSIWTFVGKVMSLLFNTLSVLVHH